jgi:hypothetical protein
MAPINHNLFIGPADIAWDDLRRLEVVNYTGDVDETLREFGWTGGPVGCIVLKLSADNASVTSGQFVARGQLARDELKVEANKLWPGAEAGAVLTLQAPNGGAFTFGDGGLCSDFLEHDQLEYCVTSGGRSPQVILHADYSAKGIGTFSIRLVCHIARASARAGVTLSYSVLAFPGTPDEICEVSDLARSPGWPGILLMEGEMALNPYPGAKWRCPVYPMVLTSIPWAEDETRPPSQELLDKIGWIMVTSEPADPIKTHKALMAKWQRFANQPDDFAPRRSPVTWPHPQQTVHTGRS